MKVTYDWLKQYTDFDIAPDDLVHTLTMLGLEVDSLEKGEWHFDGIVVGKVLTKEKHPDADKLSVCTVDTGGKQLTIVCGAPNVAAGQNVPVAQEGTELPNGAVIKSTTIRGVESHGMICSEAELGLSNRAEGIMVLDDSIAPGSSLYDALGEPEITIDIDVTPNRPDCFGALGVAREVATYSEAALKKPPIEVPETGSEIDSLFRVHIEDTEKCPRFTARYIGDVKIKPSPWWLVKKLEAVGIRSINNIVDVTNFVMMETGHPLHAYDYDLLAGQRIVVKCAEQGQEFVTLDGITHKLNNECLMICDGEKPVGIAGIMGGENTEVSDRTRNVLLECAYFDPRNIRRTSKYLEKSTEASKRFERGVDPNGLLYALNRAAQLIAELGDGTVARGAIDVYPRKIEPVTIELSPREVTRLLGVEILPARIKDILQRLGFQVHGEAALRVEVPTFRPDVTREADLVEEIARIYGYDNIPADTSALIEQLAPLNEKEKLTKKITFSLQSFDFSEITTYNLIGRKEAQLFLPGEDLVPLVNPLSEDLSVLRPSILPGLLKTLAWNVNRKSSDIKVFEIGTVFRKETGTVVEELRLGGLISGSRRHAHWRDKSEPVDFYDAKGYVEHLLGRNNVHSWSFSTVSEHGIFSPAQSLLVEFGGKPSGVLGKLQKRVLAGYDLEQEVFAFDLDLNVILEHIQLAREFQAIPKFPSITRDLAILADKELPTAAIAETIWQSGGHFLRQVDVFDVYAGDQVPPDQKSIAFKLTFLSPQRTLVEEEIDEAIQQILSVLAQKHSCTLRS